MKTSPFTSYIKTKVIIDFGNEAQAKAFFSLFNNCNNNMCNGLSLMADYLPKSIDVKRVENTKELKHNYFIKIVWVSLNKLKITVEINMLK